VAGRPVAGADLLLPEAQFTAAERRIADAYGHSTTVHVVIFAERRGAARLQPTRLGRGRTDQQCADLSDLARTAGFAVQGAVHTVR
jgi:hypothetical protein